LTSLLKNLDSILITYLKELSFFLFLVLSGSSFVFVLSYYFGEFIVIFFICLCLCML